MGKVLTAGASCGAMLNLPGGRTHSFESHGRLACSAWRALPCPVQVAGVRQPAHMLAEWGVRERWMPCRGRRNKLGSASAACAAF